MTEDTGLNEYAASIAASTIEMIRVTRAIRNALTDALTDAFGEERHYAVAIQGAEQTEDVLINDTYRIGLTPFMQPAAEMDEPEPEENRGETEAEDAGGPRAGRTPQST